MNDVVIKRVPAPELRGYPRNGNFGSQPMAYRWDVIVGNKVVSSDTRLSDAKELALMFGDNVKVER